jgi:hypothetical protein
VDGLTRGFRHAIAAFAAASLLGGCAGVRSARESVSGWLGGSEPTPRARYVGVSRARLYREADASSEVVGELAQREGVLAYRVDGEFEWVRSEATGRSGWVRASQLVDDLPRAPEPVAAPPQPAAGSEPAPAAEPPPPEPGPPAEPERSVFDPF